MTLFQRALAALAIAVALTGTSVVAVRAAYGAFDDTYSIHGLFPRAGQALVPGADVQYRGVNVGEVADIDLVDRRARIDLEIEDGFDVHESVVATVRPKTLFGEKFVELTFPHGRTGRVLGDGDRIDRAHTATEVEELIAGSVPLFDRVDPEALATVVHELSEGVKGQGQRIAAGLESGARLAGLLAATVDAQAAALDSWARFQAALEPVDDDLNALARASNDALPVINAAEADFDRMLRLLRPFADDLADILSVYRPDIDALLVDGDNVIRALVAHRQQLSETIEGLYRYAFKFGAGASAETLADGSKMAYFKVFILLQDVEHLVCNVIAPHAGTEHLQPVRDALAASALDCSDEFAAAVHGSGVAGTRPAVGDAPVPVPADVTGRLLDGLAEPDRSEPVTIEALVRRVLEAR